MNRHEQRVVAMQSVYQHLLLGKDIRKCVFDVMKGSNDIDGYLYSLTMGTIENKEAFETQFVGQEAPVLEYENERLAVYIGNKNYVEL